MKFFLLTFCASILSATVLGAAPLTYNDPAPDTLLYPEEVHFRNVQQLTNGGDNAEAYWSYDGKYIVFQRTSVKDGVPCDQIFYGKVPEKGEKFTYQLVSTGLPAIR